VSNDARVRTEFGYGGSLFGRSQRVPDIHSAFLDSGRVYQLILLNG
jgi:hypothetical protein